MLFESLKEEVSKSLTKTSICVTEEDFVHIKIFQKSSAGAALTMSHRDRWLNTTFFSLSFRRYHCLLPTCS